MTIFSCTMHRSVTDPRNGKRVALKKMPNVFQSLTSSKRAYRELKMLCFFKHNNVSHVFHFSWLSRPHYSYAGLASVIIQSAPVAFFGVVSFVQVKFWLSLDMN